MTEALALHLTDFAEVRRVDTSADATGLARHLLQAVNYLRAAAVILAHRFCGHRVVSIGCNGGLGLIYTAALVGVARLSGLRVVLHHHSYGYIDASSRVMALICRLGGTPLRHVFLAPSMRAAFAARYGAGQDGSVVANAIFVPPWPPQAPVARRLSVGLLSNLAPEKGLTDFLETAALVRAEGLEVDMVLAGPAPHLADAEVIDRSVADGFVIAHGPLYGSEKKEFFQSLDLFLFPTRYRYEAQPTVIYEAFAAGVPVIAFDRGAIRDQVGDCLAVLPRDADFAAAAVVQIRRLLALDPDERAALRARARARHADETVQGAAALSQLFAGDVT
ncbi:glycosyltransferase family 4 protein [Puniceibacterium sp. IMCC21224]|uniref:glycosyltransferase family 4 protein n=1 Tax=Puniceibacterium sp. IMCC21224 TaxID=1618204 RepID=UPI00069D7B13|nr:glycosyltransferase family 4 protein [Puniceibacterium sp. IMCC21224]